METRAEFHTRVIRGMYAGMKASGETDSGMQVAAGTEAVYMLGYADAVRDMAARLDDIGCAYDEIRTFAGDHEIDLSDMDAEDAP